jgi:quercetin dioxygenase-like cupin family protein
MTHSKLFALALTLVVLQGGAVPVDKEPKHHLVLENEWVRVFDVTVAPSDSTLYHVHARDYLFVTLGDANVQAQPIGGAAGPLKVADGEVRFTKATITHRVVNPATSPRFHNLTIEVVKTPSEAKGVAPAPPASAPTAHGRSLVLENDRVRVERLVLEPGDSTGMHTHARPGLAVIVHPATLTVTVEGGTPQREEYKAGDFAWSGAARTHALVNSGRTRFEVVEIEWK